MTVEPADHFQPLTNEQVIEQLTDRGIRATACPECGRVKEVVDDKIVVHNVSALRVCPGAGLDLLGDVEGQFERLVCQVTQTQTEDEADRYGAMAAREAVDRLTFLLDAAQTRTEVNRDSTIYGAAGQEFCGCPACIVREVILVVWPYACHAQFTDMMEVLIETASDLSVSLTTRHAAQVLAERIVDRHEQQQNAE